MRFAGATLIYAVVIFVLLTIYLICRTTPELPTAALPQQGVDTVFGMGATHSDITHVSPQVRSQASAVLLPTKPDTALPPSPPADVATHSLAPSQVIAVDDFSRSRCFCGLPAVPAELDFGHDSNGDWIIRNGAGHATHPCSAEEMQKTSYAGGIIFCIFENVCLDRRNHQDINSFPKFHFYRRRGDDSVLRTFPPFLGSKCCNRVENIITTEVHEVETSPITDMKKTAGAATSSVHIDGGATLFVPKGEHSTKNSWSSPDVDGGDISFLVEMSQPKNPYHFLHEGCKWIHTLMTNAGVHPSHFTKVEVFDPFSVNFWTKVPVNVNEFVRPQYWDYTDRLRGVKQICFQRPVAVRGSVYSATNHTQFRNMMVDRYLGPAARMELDAMCDNITTIRIVYMKRRGVRRISNEDDMQRYLDVLSSLGAVVTTADFTADTSFAEQMRTVTKGTVLIGPHGAGLAHAMWMPPACGVVVELLGSTLAFEWRHMMASLAAAQGMRPNLQYYEGRPTPVFWDNFPVDLSKFHVSLTKYLMDNPYYAKLVESWTHVQILPNGSRSSKREL